MIHRSICPICGSENPEGAEFCQVCNANLNALPDEFFTTDVNPVNPPQAPEIVPEPAENDEPDLDSPVPVWLQKRFQKTEKPDMDSYVDALFGMSGGRTSTTGILLFFLAKASERIRMSDAFGVSILRYRSFTPFGLPNLRIALCDLASIV